MKNKLMLAVLCVLSVLFVSGCRFHEIDYSGNAKNVISKEQAETTILRIMSEQFTRGSVVTQLTVNDECISFNECHRPLATLGTLNSKVTINFVTSYNIEIFRHRRSRSCDVVIWNNGAPVCEIVCFSMAEAMEFADAYKFMHDYNSNKARPSSDSGKGAVKP